MTVSDLGLDGPRLLADSIAGKFPDAHGRYGPYGGRYVPETLIPALDELEAAYKAARGDAEFERELSRLLTECANRPTPLYFARKLTEKWGGARVYLKREDLAHTG